MTSKHITNESPDGPVAEIVCPGTVSEVAARMEAAARRGKLPGFTLASGADTGRLFDIVDFGSPFESRMTGKGVEAAGGTRILLNPPRLKPAFPWGFALILVLTIWPGAWLTDSMVRSYWDWYSSRPWWVTYAWYLPLTVPFCPMAMLSALRKSRASAAAEIPDLVEKIVAATGGRVASELK